MNDAKRVALDIEIAFDTTGHWHVYEKRADFLFKSGDQERVISPNLNTSHADMIAYDFFIKGDLRFRRCAMNWTSETGKLRILYDGSVAFLNSSAFDAIVRDHIPAGIVVEAEEW